VDPRPDRALGIHTLTKEKIMYSGGLAGIAVLILMFLLWGGRF